MQGMSAFFPKEIPDDMLIEAMARQFQISPDQIFIYTELDEFSEVEERGVVVLCRNMRLNTFLPSFVDVSFLDEARSWDHVATLKSLCSNMETFCFFEDDTLQNINPYEYYRMDQDGTVEKGLIIPAMLISDEDVAELSAGEVAEVEEERAAYKEGWWRAY